MGARPCSATERGRLGTTRCALVTEDDVRLLVTARGWSRIVGNYPASDVSSAPARRAMRRASAAENPVCISSATISS
jgi:hypothetical protein